MSVFATEFPPLSHIVNWPGFAGTEGQWYEFNKIVLVYVLAMLMIFAFFWLGSRKKALVPRGTQNLAELAVEFIEDGIVMDTMGEPGRKYSPYLMTLFFFVWFTNIFGIIPVIQMPASARIALPLFLALLAYFVYHISGMIEHGPLKYFKHALVPPGVPWPLLFLVVPIEFISKFLVQPFSHTVRLFANMLAGHILLVTFGVLTAALIGTGVLATVVGVLPLVALIFFTLFEVLVAFLQAYVFTLLTGVYINAAISHDH